jgi:hypothetical protein
MFGIVTPLPENCHLNQNSLLFQVTDVDISHYFDSVNSKWFYFLLVELQRRIPCFGVKVSSFRNSNENNLVFSDSEFFNTIRLALNISTCIKPKLKPIKFPYKRLTFEIQAIQSHSDTMYISEKYFKLRKPVKMFTRKYPFHTLKQFSLKIYPGH